LFYYFAEFRSQPNGNFPGNSPRYCQFCLGFFLSACGPYLKRMVQMIANACKLLPRDRRSFYKACGLGWNNGFSLKSIFDGFLTRTFHGILLGRSLDSHSFLLNPGEHLKPVLLSGFHRSSGTSSKRRQIQYGRTLPPLGRKKFGRLYPCSVGLVASH